MKLDPKQISKIDSSGYGKIQIEFKESINIEGYIALPAFDIREDLRVKYYAPHHRKEALVTISWLNLETPDELLVHVFSHFGRVKSNVMWNKIREEEGEGETEQLLNNIMNGERQLWIEVNHPLPSYAVIDNRRVKIHHAGQKRTCARCQKVADKCKGNSNAKLCEENGGEKVAVSVAWAEILDSLNYVKWNGEGRDNFDEDEQENTFEAESAESTEDKADISNCDGFVISNLEEDASIEEIKRIIKGAAPDSDIAGITVHPTGSTRSKIVKDINPVLVKNISKKIENKSYKGRLLHCRPHVPISPPSKKIPGTMNKDTKTVTKPDSDRSEIPGLAQKDVEKAKKKAEKLKKKEITKERKERKRSDKVETQKPVSNMTTSDFLLNSTGIDDKLEGFVFGDSSEEEFEDSVEIHQKEEADINAESKTPVKGKRSNSSAELSPLESADPKKKLARNPTSGQRELI